MTLQSGFTLGNWMVYPLEGRLVGARGEQRLQPKTMDVLLCLAEGGGAVVQREEILRQVWGERAQSDEPLTRCIGELRRALGDTRTEPEYILTIPKRGYRLLQSAVPLVSDPAAEDEQSRSGKADAPQLTEPQKKLRLDTVKKIAIAVVVLLAAALVEVVFERVLEDSEIDIGGDDPPGTELMTGVALDEKSIAVLPFLNMSADSDQEYFSDGISEELLNLLTRVPDLRVISRTSAFSYKDKDLDIPTIAAQLNVAHVLEGSVRMSGDQVRVTAQLIDARSDTHLWSETYDRRLDDIFAVQDEIASTVVSQLKLTLLGEAPQVETTDPEAFALFLKARHIARRFTADDIQRSIALYKEALLMDPDYAAAWTGLAGDYVNLATNALLPFEEGFNLAREAANSALAVDPEQGGAYAYLAWIAMWHDHDLAAAARNYERALALKPADLGIIGNAALLLKGLGRLDEAVALLEFQAARDPVNATAQYNLGLSYLSAGRWNESIDLQRTVLQLSPDYFGVHSFIGTALLMLGEAEQALEAMQQEPSEAYRLLGFVMANHALGRAEASDVALAEMVEKYEREWAYNIAYVLAFRNNADRAFEWLDKAVEYGDPGLADIVGEILFSSLHLDPRWTAFLLRIGKAPEQLRAIEFDVTMPE